jgi:ABC-type spermidine/putrescine transport system permease subunit I
MNLLPPAWRGNLWAVGLVETANYLPFMVLPLLRALERIDPSLGPAAMDLGASPWQSFWHVHWPLTRPGMLAGAVLVFIPVTGEFLAPKFVGEGRPETEVLGTLIWKQFTEGRNWPYGAAASLWLLALVLPALLLALALRAEERSRP